MAGWRTFSTFTPSAMTGMYSTSPTSPLPWAPSRLFMRCSSPSTRIRPRGGPMRSKTFFRLAVLGAVELALTLSACDSLRRDAGLTKQAPDEFAVVTKAPLIIPPNFNLRPPAPGAPPLNQQDPTSNAEAALFNSSDPSTVAAGMGGSYTMGERMLLANAGVQ